MSEVAVTEEQREKADNEVKEALARITQALRETDSSLGSHSAMILEHQDGLIDRLFAALKEKDELLELAAKVVKRQKKAAFWNGFTVAVAICLLIQITVSFLFGGAA